MYRLPQFDIGWQKYADLFRLERNDKDRERDAFDNIPPEIFASKALLAYGIRTDTFDLVPTVRNYEKLIDNVSHTCITTTTTTTTTSTSPFYRRCSIEVRYAQP